MTHSSETTDPHPQPQPRKPAPKNNMTPLFITIGALLLIGGLIWYFWPAKKVEKKELPGVTETTTAPAPAATVPTTTAPAPAATVPTTTAPAPAAPAPTPAPKVNKTVVSDGYKKTVTARASYVKSDSSAVAKLVPPGWTLVVKPR